MSDKDISFFLPVGPSGSSLVIPNGEWDVMSYTVYKGYPPGNLADGRMSTFFHSAAPFWAAGQWVMIDFYEVIKVRLSDF